MIFNGIQSVNKVFVLCPAGYKTGGTELAHQLVYELNQMKVESYITYFSKEKNIRINNDFLCYVDSFLNLADVEDRSENVVIAPETAVNLLDMFIKVQKCVWWMSVDNFIASFCGIRGSLKAYGFRTTLGRLYGGMVKSYKLDKNYYNFYQSEYARQYLERNGYQNRYRLSDYLNPVYFSSGNMPEERSDQVIYNPQKGYAFTKKIIHASPDLTWIPIQKMSNKEVVHLLKKSKVYIDFGNHPGKDRIPREAVISGCCVITNKRGAAAFYEDIPIDDRFKFEEDQQNIPKIVREIRECMSDYPQKSKQFETYRKKIRGERKQFLSDIKDIFI